jgi:hypothetical protein
MHIASTDATGLDLQQSSPFLGVGFGEDRSTISNVLGPDIPRFHNKPLSFDAFLSCL